MRDTITLPAADAYIGVPTFAPISIPFQPCTSWVMSPPGTGLPKYPSISMPEPPRYGFFLMLARPPPCFVAPDEVGAAALSTPPGMMRSEPATSAAEASSPLNEAISSASEPYFFAREASVSSFATLCLRPETGRMRRVSPGWISFALLRSFAQRMVLADTSNMSAISESVSPERTT